MGPAKKGKWNDGQKYQWLNLDILDLCAMNVRQMDDSQEVVCMHNLSSLSTFYWKVRNYRISRLVY